MPANLGLSTFPWKERSSQNSPRSRLYLSFGQKFQPETLRYVPEDRFLLETDESLSPIREIYQEAASTRKTTVEQLEKAVSSTINKLFFSR